MKKRITLDIIICIVALVTVVFSLVYGYRSEFFPAVKDFCSKLFNKDDEISPMDTSEYILLSTLSDSALLGDIDILVPNDTYIPNEEEISKAYSGLYSDSIVASRPNYDIIIQNYGIKITEGFKLVDFRDLIVSNLQKSRPDISFDTSHTITKNDIEIPVIEFSTEYESRITYSFIALVDVKGELITIAVNSADFLFDSTQFFNTLISNMVIK